MPNPAELLYNQLKAWESPQIFLNSQKDNEHLEKHRQAVRYLNQIEQLLDIAEQDGKRVSGYRKRFPFWVKAVFGYPDWGNASTLYSAHVEHLEHLIDVLDNYVHRIDETKLHQFEAYLEDFADKLHEDTRLPESVKTSVSYTILHLQDCIRRIHIIGEFDFQQQMERFYGCIITVGQATVDEQHLRGWKNFFQQFVNPFMVNTLSSLTAASVLMLLPPTLG